MIRYTPEGRAYCDCGCEFCLMNPTRLGLVLDPYVAYDECAVAIATLDAYLAKRGVMSALKVFYVLASHAAGPERKMILHSVDPDTARRMAWMKHQGSRRHWSLTVIEAGRFEDLEVIR